MYLSFLSKNDFSGYKLVCLGLQNEQSVWDGGNQEKLHEKFVHWDWLGIAVRLVWVGKVGQGN
jgi:hypothetical protein